MDNLTHSLVGLALGEAASVITKASPKKRALLLTAGVVANNFPDLDGLYTGIAPTPLGYLLHHRGHTHTLGGALIEWFLILGILWLLPSFRNELKEKRTTTAVGLLVALGLFTHVWMDSWNSYGVHALWPLSSKWYFGDAIFIIEPLIWACLAWPLIWIFKNNIFRFVLGFIVCAVPVWAWHSGYLTTYSIGFLALMSGIFILILQKMSEPAKKLRLALVSTAVVLLVQFSLSARVKNLAHQDFKPESPRHRILEVIANPSPANPFCWQLIQLEVNEDQGIYRGQSKIASVFPSIVSAEKCPTIRVQPVTFDINLQEFQSARARDCYLDAWLHYARAPILMGNQAFDLRFGDQPSENFTELKEAGSERLCPPYLARWTKPRRDLFGD